MKRTNGTRHPGQTRSKPRGLSGSPAYPFSGIVGQEEMKLGLILNVIDPTIGGVLMMGHRGTGKSTAVRALADLLPDISINRGCLFNCEPGDTKSCCTECDLKMAGVAKTSRERCPVPVVDLPLGATEDRVCGSIDIQRALNEGVKAFEPGLLARANRGFLYVDEVNLLEDHLVDLLLDVAVTGRNKVERENISVEHPARFVLVGSGNPEEGELRPQLLDRFGLYVEVKTENEVELRVRIIECRESFERDSEKFCAAREPEQKDLRQRIARASRNFSRVKVGAQLLRQIATLCSELQVDGHRGELTIMRAARALAAFSNRRSVCEEDVRRVATMSLRHRLHRDALSEASVSTRIEQAVDRVFAKTSPRTGQSNSGSSSGGSGNNDGRSRSPAGNKYWPELESHDELASENQPPLPALLEARLTELSSGLLAPHKMVEKSQRGRTKSGRVAYNSRHGRYMRAVSQQRAGAAIALDATLRALAADGYRHAMATADTQGLDVPARDIAATALRFKQLARKQGTLFIFAIDTSGSMAHKRINQARGALLNLLRESYINRDQIAMVGFRGVSAEILLPVTRSMMRAKRALDSLSIGGGTPLSAGLSCSLELAQRALTRHEGEITLLLFTDGGANVPMSHGVAVAGRKVRQDLIAGEVSLLGSKLRGLGVQVVVIEPLSGFSPDSNVRGVAAQLGARHLRLSTGNQPAIHPIV